jgi:hypothetical protein
MPNPHAQLEQWTQELIALTRRIKMRYPATTQNMVTIQSEVMRAMKEAIQSNPAPEPMAPPN